MMKHIYRKAERSPEETANLRAARERYQREKPSPEQLLAEGGHQDFIPLGELIALRKVMAALKKERENKGITLAMLSELTGIDQAALSRLETGSHGNPTLDTLYRIALALGKEIACVLHDTPADMPNEKEVLAGV